MKKVVKKIALLLIVFCFGVGVTLLYMNNKYKVYEEEEPKQIKKHVDTISMMLETEAKSGNYELTTASSWPTDGYKFNSELSKCENGSELSWDDTNKRVVMSGNKSDKCYVYFDVYVPPTIADFCNSGDTLATCVKTFGNQGVDISSIYVHNSSLTNGAGDSSYRYSGANPNNYVCFGINTTPCPEDNLYRIIGVFDGRVKLIKSDYATSALLGTDGDYKQKFILNNLYSSSYKGNNLDNIAAYYWNKTAKNTWSLSNLNRINLNQNFITNIGADWANKIDMTTWKVGGNSSKNIIYAKPSVVYQNEIVNPSPGSTSSNGETEYSVKIGLMYVSDYMYAASQDKWTLIGSDVNSSKAYTAAISVNWMHMGLHEWTISRYVDSSSSAFCVYGDGKVNYSYAGNSFAVRPVFNLISSTTYVSGDGTKTEPICIS